MKKVLSAVVLSAAVVATAGQAYAYAPGDQFGTFSLTMGMYTPDAKVEIGRNLGVLANTDGFGNAATNLTLTETNKSLGSVNYQALAAARGANAGDLQIGFIVDGVTAVNFIEPKWDLYFATTKNTAPPLAPTLDSFFTFNDGSGSINAYYKNADSDNDGVMSMAGGLAGGWRLNMDAYGEGVYALTNNQDFRAGSKFVKNIAGDYQDFYLYHYQVLIADETNFENPYVPYLVEGATADYSAVLRFNKANGEVILNPTAAPVPVPAAAWLLGSGVLGLIGLRRRNA
jgi:hypothetical protein